MSTKTTWVEVEYRGEEALRLIKTVMDSKCSGQIVLNVSEGTVCTVKWREPVKVGKIDQVKIILDRAMVPHDSMTAEST